MEVCITLQNKIPEEAELYVAVQGSELTHVTPARRGDDGLTLSFTAPGYSLHSVSTNAKNISLSLSISHFFIYPSQAMTT